MSEYIAIYISNDEDGETAKISTEFGEEGMGSWEGTPAGSIAAAFFRALNQEGAEIEDEE